ncbi:MAG: rhodanese-like domain-containing protein [Phycisphaerales bacterium]|nr:rhodanese-like domain-containing protein [Phycisphaerales bacterium]
MAETTPNSASPSSTSNAPWELTPEDVVELQRRGDDFLLLDCRSGEEWESGGIKGAISLPLQQMSTRCPELEPHRKRPIVIYCRTGRRSVIVAKFLKLAGFDHVRSMAGGYEAWTSMNTTAAGND